METTKDTARLGTLSEEALRADLERYRRKALELGASGAKIIAAEEVPLDERVRLKCIAPRCPRAGETPNCPPFTPEVDEVRRALSKYSWAVLLKTDVQPLAEYMPVKGGSRKTLSFHARSGEIVTQIETLAFNEGYHLAAGLGGGSCKDYLCGGEVCQFLDSGRCRFPVKARPSMEAMGIDVFRLVNRVGWSIYPVAQVEAAPHSVPCAISVGIVFIY